ncbi:MAG: hypothetical protein HY586_01000, partial [Candidatus Omnitrophica bacterium]|nr:hypothetical protein [Candidatus Omnitrophota bacterium]
DALPLQENLEEQFPGWLGSLDTASIEDHFEKAHGRAQEEIEALRSRHMEVSSISETVASFALRNAKLTLEIGRLKERLAALYGLAEGAKEADNWKNTPLENLRQMRGQTLEYQVYASNFYLLLKVKHSRLERLMETPHPKMTQIAALSKQIKDELLLAAATHQENAEKLEVELQHWIELKQMEQIAARFENEHPQFLSALEEQAGRPNANLDRMAETLNRFIAQLEAEERALNRFAQGLSSGPGASTILLQFAGEVTAVAQRASRALLEKAGAFREQIPALKRAQELVIQAEMAATDSVGASWSVYYDTERLKRMETLQQASAVHEHAEAKLADARKKIEEIRAAEAALETLLLPEEAIEHARTQIREQLAKARKFYDQNPEGRLNALRLMAAFDQILQAMRAAEEKFGVKNVEEAIAVLNEMQLNALIYYFQRDVEKNLEESRQQRLEADKALYEAKEKADVLDRLKEDVREGSAALEGLPQGFANRLAEEFSSAVFRFQEALRSFESYAAQIVRHVEALEKEMAQAVRELAQARGVVASRYGNAAQAAELLVAEPPSFLTSADDRNGYDSYMAGLEEKLKVAEQAKKDLENQEEWNRALGRVSSDLIEANPDLAALVRQAKEDFEKVRAPALQKLSDAIPPLIENGVLAVTRFAVQSGEISVEVFKQARTAIEAAYKKSDGTFATQPEILAQAQKIEAVIDSEEPLNRRLLEANGLELDPLEKSLRETETGMRLVSLWAKRFGIGIEPTSGAAIVGSWDLRGNEGIKTRREFEKLLNWAQIKLQLDGLYEQEQKRILAGYEILLGEIRNFERNMP